MDLPQASQPSCLLHHQSASSASSHWWRSGHLGGKNVLDVVLHSLEPCNFFCLAWQFVFRAHCWNCRWLMACKCGGLTDIVSTVANVGRYLIHTLPIKSSHLLSKCTGQFLVDGSVDTQTNTIKFTMTDGIQVHVLLILYTFFCLKFQVLGKYRETDNLQYQIGSETIWIGAPLVVNASSFDPWKMSCRFAHQQI